MYTFQGRFDLYDLYDMYDVYDLSHVTGWEPPDVHHRGHVSWVGYVLPAVPRRVG